MKIKPFFALRSRVKASRLLFKLFVVGTVFFTGAALAKVHVYVGALLGGGWVDYSGYAFPAGIEPTSISDSNFATNFQLGSSFNRYLAAELGAIYFTKVIFNNITPNQNGRFKNNVAYLVAKVSIPVSSTIDLFAKAGVGYVVRNAVVTNDVCVVSSGEFVRPVYGLGMTWQLATHWDMEFVWVGVPGLPEQQLPFSNFIGVGAHYLFS